MKNTFLAIVGILTAVIGLTLWAVGFFSAKQQNKKPIPGTPEYARAAKAEKKKLEIVPDEPDEPEIEENGELENEIDQDNKDVG